MTDEEQIIICKQIVAACMFGFGGVGSIALEGLDKKLPLKKKWVDVAKEHEAQARYERVGVIKDEAELQRRIADGYRLLNYSPGELHVFRPPQFGNCLSSYVVGELADKYGEIHDPWNFRVYKERRQAEQRAKQ